MYMTYPEKLEVIRRHQNTAPVNTVPIAEAMGVRVWTAGDWPENLLGKIMRSQSRGGSAGYAIFVNRNMPKVRRRFTIAHEIAHYVLHEEHIGDGIVDDALYRSRLSNAMEVQANKLAADILMPWHLVNPMINRGISNPAELARRFEVSEAAMAIRLNT